MTDTATGLVVRTRPLTETSLVVHWLTAGQGRVATVAKGARRPKSPFAGKLDLFYLADFSFNRSRRSELHNLCEVKLLSTHAALREELGWLQQASYCAALLEKTTETDTPLAGVFEMMHELLSFLPRQAPMPHTIFAFELKLLQFLGLSPDLEEGRLPPGTQKLAAALLAAPWELVPRLKPSPSQGRELAQFLHGFIIYHVGKIPSGRFAALGHHEVG